MQNQMKTETEPHTERKHVRHEFQSPIPVINAVDGESLGALVNITIEGMMIMANQPLESNRIYQVTLQLPNSINDNETIELGLDCLWTRGDEQYGRYWAGFQIIDASQTAVKMIEYLIREYSEANQPAS